MQTLSQSEPGSQERGSGRRPHDPDQQPDANHEQPNDLCHLGCGEITSERNRYYTGKYMTARDFQDEQDYFLSRHYLHNRLLHGWGIVCGLVVTPHKGDRCSDRYVVVSPGVAIDCCGREVVLKERKVVKIWNPLPAPQPRPRLQYELDEENQGEAWEREEFRLEVEQAEKYLEEAVEEEEKTVEGADGQEFGLMGRPGRERHPRRRRQIGGLYLLVLRYEERGVEWAPALYAEGACDPRQMEANRVREITSIEVLPWDRERYGSCWPIPEPDQPKERVPCRDDCGSETGAGAEGCIDSACACKYGVPLALVTPTYSWRTREWQIGDVEIDTRGRHELRTPPEYLTHIVDYNWTHGGTLRLSELNDPNSMDGKLRIYFDRRLKEFPDDPGVGVNEHTFMVYYHNQEETHYSLEVLFNDGNPPFVENNEGSCCAVFPIDRRMLSGDVNLDNLILYVNLKCDFILDCHDRPVDGEHRRGQTPTGDGYAGGTFESWFRVVDDEREQRNKARRQRDRK